MSVYTMVTRVGPIANIDPDDGLMLKRVGMPDISVAVAVSFGMVRTVPLRPSSTVLNKVDGHVTFGGVLSTV